MPKNAFHEIGSFKKIASSLFRVTILLFLVATVSGCIVSKTALFDPKPAGTPAFRDVGKEGAKSSLPKYFLEAPDIITVEAVHLVPKDPYILRVFDVIALDVVGTPDEEPVQQPG